MGTVMPTRVKRESFEIDEAEPVRGGRSRCNDASLRGHMPAAVQKVNPSASAGHLASVSFTQCKLRNSLFRRSTQCQM
jgi:hypothetical protein